MTGWCLSPRRRFVTELILSMVGPRRPSQLLTIASSARPAGTSISLWRILPASAQHLWRPRAWSNWPATYPVPQTGTDHLRHGHAPRPSHLQSGPQTCQLGTRLGVLCLVVVVFGHRAKVWWLAALVPALSQPPRAHQGAQGQKTPARSQPSHPSRTVPRDAGPAGVVVSAAPVRGPAATVPTAARASCGTCRPTWTSSAMSIPRGACTRRHHHRSARGGRGPREARLAPMAQWAADASQPWTELCFDQFGLHATLAVKTRHALYYKAGKDRLLTIVLVHDLAGQRPSRCSTVRVWTGTRGGSWPATPPAGPSK